MIAIEADVRVTEDMRGKYTHNPAPPPAAVREERMQMN
jgi:hypothetical protein